MGRLAAVIIEICRKLQAPQQAGGVTTENLFLGGTVSTVKGSGRISVSTDAGQGVEASPVTDEVFTVGQRVWVSQMEDSTYIVHGGIR